MKYNLNEFNKAVQQYKKLCRQLSKKTIQIILQLQDDNAFFSFAPLSMALHELNADLRVSILDKEKKSKNFLILEHLWGTFEEMKTGKENRETTALKEFINAVNKKAKNKKFETYLRKPDVILESNEKCFCGKNICLRYYPKWFKEFKEKRLMNTCAKVLEHTFNLSAGEKFSVGFELMPTKKELELPLEDYLDNFVIARAMALQALKRNVDVSLGSSTNKKSRLSEPNRISELAGTISGCEYDKEVREPVFQAFKKLSNALKINGWEYVDASFSIHGKGYGGKHFFGMNIGYPSLDRKTRWNSPSNMMLKAWWHPQTKIDKRMPTLRLAITETIPIQEFIETVDIDLIKMRKRNIRIKEILDKCEKLQFIGEKQGKFQTNFVVDLARGKFRRTIEASDSDARFKIDKEIKKVHGINSGMFANVPGGETFFTPESINGTLVGDVVINLDRSHVLSSKDPVIWEFRKGKYKTIRAPAVIKKQLQKEYKDLKKLLKEYEKKKSLPRNILKMYKDNFWRVGECAINTNPKAKLSRYLIVNEKIAKMIHIAVGSGFEPDRQTVYHWDMVANAPKQKMNIYGIDKKERQHWIIKKGEFVV